MFISECDGAVVLLGDTGPARRSARRQTDISHNQLLFHPDFSRKVIIYESFFLGISTHSYPSGLHHMQYRLLSLCLASRVSQTIIGYCWLNQLGCRILPFELYDTYYYSLLVATKTGSSCSNRSCARGPRGRRWEQLRVTNQQRPLWAPARLGINSTSQLLPHL